MNTDVLKVIKLLNGWMTDDHCTKHNIDPVDLEDLIKDGFVARNDKRRYVITRSGEDVLNPKVKKSRKKA